MTITAKFASVCPCCNLRIQPGSKVEWVKGSKARHVYCAAKPGAVSVASKPAAARRAYPSCGRRTGCSCGSVDGVERQSDCWQCQHDY